MRGCMLENVARRKATLTAKSYGWTVLEQKQRKQDRTKPESKQQIRHRSVKRSGSYGLYSEALQMLPVEEFNRHVKGRISSMFKGSGGMAPKC